MDFMWLQDFLIKGATIDEIARIGYYLRKDKRMTKEDNDNLNNVMAAIDKFNSGIKHKIMTEMH